jgi:thiol-disulfide isomerase/thioredoxin
MKAKSIISLVIIAALVVLVVVGLSVGNSKSDSPKVSRSELTTFAQCIAQSGAKFYGAYWCPHCQEQKQLFGGAQKDLPYVECAVVGDRQTQTPECKEAGVTSYPTWQFANGERATGKQTLEFLAQATGCQIDAGVAEEEVTVDTETTTEQSDVQE